jgi:hypothetical protein
MWTLSVALIALTGLLSYLTPEVPRQGWFSSSGWNVLLGTLWLGYPTVGTLIASRHPKNPIGWIFVIAGFLFIVPLCAQGYANYSVFERPTPLPATQYAALVSESGVVIPGMILVMVLLFSLFPDGHLLSRNWRVVPWAAIIGGMMVILWMATWPGPMYAYPSIDNPFGLKGSLRDVVEVSGRVGLLLLLVSWIIAAISLMLRREEARGVERQQIKWFAYGLLLIVLSLVQPWYLTVPALALLPIATGVAILKHRLYDIDLLINRTLVYGSLTAMLVALYFGGIVLLQRLFVVLTGEKSTLAVVASTLVIAALFNPLRRRIQSFIDRRFYRHKYDAARTLEAFSSKLRDETNLEALNDDLVGVIRETMQPAHVSLWLRPDSPSKRKVGTPRD